MRTLSCLALVFLSGCPEVSDDSGDTGDVGTDCDEPLSYADVDGDGFGDQATQGCVAGGGRVDNGDDCDDTDADINPEGREFCDGVDSDCDGGLDTADGRPVCDDALEDNDSRFDASQGVSTPGLVALQGDPDFFDVPVCAGRDTTVTIAFDHEVGDLAMRIYDRNGGLIVEQDGQTDVEAVTLSNPSDINDFAVIEVVAAQSNTYDLTVEQSAGTCNDSAVLAKVEAFFGDDVVYNNVAAPDPTQDPMDVDGNVFWTRAIAGAETALPDDGVFPQNEDHAAMRLPFSELDDGPNARILAPGESQSIALPALPFITAHVLGTATDGSTTVRMVVRGSGVDLYTEDVAVNDWFGSVPASGSYALITGMTRFDFDDNFGDTRANFSVWGHPLDLAQQSVANSVVLENQGPGNYVLMGVAIE